MESNTNRYFLIIIILVLGVSLFSGFSNQREQGISVSSADNIDSWETLKVNGADYQILEEQIKSFKESAETSNNKEEQYDLMISIANNYKSLGDGENTFLYLNKAITINPKNSLAYVSLGTLMRELGANNTARYAYELGVQKESKFIHNHTFYLDFLVSTPGTSDEDIETAFSGALLDTGRHGNVLKLYAAWLEDKGENDKAIEIWEEILADAASNKEVIQDKINSLK